MPLSGPAPLTVVFAFTGSSDVTAYLWSFGDGNTSTAAGPSNTYAVAGTYTVTLIVTGSHGSATISDTVIVGTASAVWTPPDPAYGLSPGGDPQVMLRCSNDGGKTWGSEVWRSAGKAGEYSRRIRWNGLGSGRRRVFEVVMTDPVLWRITGCYIESFVAGVKGQ